MMSAPAAKLMVMVGEHFACVKVSGRANFTSSVDFKAALTELRRKGYPYLVIELSECALMDSTFLGVLAEFGLKAMPQEGDCERSAIELRNANERLIELLENLGVLHLFKTAQGTVSAVGDIQTSSPAHCNPSREELTRASLEAHQMLMKINPENEARFKDVTKFLTEDLQKIREKQATDRPAQPPV
jgi:anti-sigma B factor antagonist